jgi:hypothetical protein
VTAEPADPPGVPQRGRLGTGGAIALLLGILVTAAVVLGTVWVLGNQQRIIDQFAVWGYEPDAAISGYADRAELTDEGRFLFYASRPQVEPEAAFDEVCTSGTEGFGILGCYLPDDRRIYLYDVTDDRLDGLEEVVASHEMLHAAWDRMSDDEHAALAPLLEAAADRLSDDADFAATMEFYAENEPGQRLNELHSILGTEFADLGPELEAHYAQYLADRAVIVALHDRTNAVFVDQQNRAAALVAQMDALATSIDGDYATYSAGYAALNDAVADFNARADRGDFGSQNQFDAERNALIARRAELDASYAAIQDRLAEYDQLVLDLKALNEEIDGLNASVNIGPPEAPDLSEG